VLLNLIDFGMNVQEAGDAARFRHDPEGISLESAFETGVRQDLRERGHDILGLSGAFGGYQAIMIDPDTGALAGGSDHRKDGQAVGY
jgi:gamma-glutamyltranspeptidase/glutathione hydrolase